MCLTVGTTAQKIGWQKKRWLEMDSSQKNHTNFGVGISDRESWISLKTFKGNCGRHEISLKTVDIHASDSYWSRWDEQIHIRM